MTTNYPAALDTFTTKVDGVDDVMAAHVNELQTDVVAIETELGTNPKGAAADVKARIAATETVANGAIQKSLVDAKGDLIVATADNTPARLAVGASDGMLLTVDAASAGGIKWAVPASGGDPAVVDGRLTLESGNPVSSTDQVGKSTLYFTPYKGNKVGLYNGATWDIITFAELSLNIGAYTANKNYDIWVYNNAGTATLDSTVWTNDSTRATALAYQDGIMVKNGTATRRYLGTIRIDAAGGTATDSMGTGAGGTKGIRGVWNLYNQVHRPLYAADASTTTYNTSAWRAWNNDATLRVSFVVGIGWMVTGHIGGGCQVSTAGSTNLIALALDSTTVVANSLGFAGNNNVQRTIGGAGGVVMVAAGYHYIQAIQYGPGVGTGTFETIHLKAELEG